MDIDKLRTAVVADTSQNTLELAATISTILKHKEKISKDKALDRRVPMNARREIVNLIFL